MPSPGLRQRRKKKTQTPPPTETKDEKIEEPEPQDERPLKEVFLSHPLGFCIARVLPVIVVSYGLYLGYYFLQLQRPDWVSSVTMGMVTLRPAISPTQQRQVLIVGTMSSGTTQSASDLSKKLGLEVGHEDSDAQWNFVRDGTVSWFHGIRFLPPHASPKEKLETFRHLCINYSFNMGFHPQMYHASSKCSSRFSKEWNNCWARECIDVVEKEWNCAIQQNCQVNFANTLLQVRNPLRTMESLVAKFCIGGMDGEVQPAFVTLLRGLFPNSVPEHLSCIEAAAYYVVNYTNALLQANNDGYLQGMYQIETTSPCQVARLAGLYNESSSIYKPNHDVVRERCLLQEADHDAQQVMTSSEHRINVDLVKLSWSDLEGGKHGSQRPMGSADVEESVRDLFDKLGYDALQEENIENDPIFNF